MRFNGKRTVSMTVLIYLLSVVFLVAQAQSPGDDLAGRHTRERGFWIDTSGLMWSGKDSGKELNWGNAVRYCRNLRLAGFSDWRLPKIYELQDIYHADLETPGLAGPGKGRDFTWHVQGGLFLTGDEWSSNRGVDDRGHPTGYAYYFDFNSGKALNYDEPSAGKRALCVRDFEKK
jgi:hypothetical protein